MGASFWGNYSEEGTMKKVLPFRTAILVISMGVILLVGVTTVQAGKSVLIDDFTDWASDPWGTGAPVTLTPNGGKVTIVANGSAGETWGGIYDDNTTLTAIGMKATINISKVSAATGNVQIGISNSLGLVGNQRIQATIMYEANNSTQSRIRWRVRSKDNTVSGATWSTLATGTLADLWSSGYNTGENITVFFKRVKNGISFGIVGTPYTVTWKSNETMTAINYYPELFGYAPSGNNIIKGSIKNVYMLY
jgi:hypothetical protein